LTEEDILVLEPPRQREERGRHLAAAGLVVDRWWLTPFTHILSDHLSITHAVYVETAHRVGQREKMK